MLTAKSGIDRHARLCWMYGVECRVSYVPYPLTPVECGRNCAGDIWKVFFHWVIWYVFWLKCHWMLLVRAPIGNKPSLAQGIAWCRTNTSHCLNQWLIQPQKHMASLRYHAPMFLSKSCIGMRFSAPNIHAWWSGPLCPTISSHINGEVHSHFTRQSEGLFIPTFKTNLGKTCLSYRGPFILNKILRLKINLDTSEAVFMKTLNTV